MKKLFEKCKQRWKQFYRDRHKQTSQLTKRVIAKSFDIEDENNATIVEVEFSSQKENPSDKNDPTSRITHYPPSDRLH